MHLKTRTCTRHIRWRSGRQLGNREEIQTAAAGGGGEETYPVAVVADFNDEVVLAEVPHRRSPAGVGRGQDVLDLSVPRHKADVLHGLMDENQTSAALKTADKRRRS